MKLKHLRKKLRNPAVSMSRTQMINTISEILLPNGHIVHKLDFLGTVCIYGHHYFNVWRRYNNVHEIVIEDFSGDFHFSKNFTIRQTIQNILCLSNEQMKGLYTIYGISYKHRADIIEEVTSMRWTDIQRRWYAVDINLGGILQDFHNISPFQDHEVVMPPLEDDSTQVQLLQIKSEQEEQPLKSEQRFHSTKRNLSERFAEVENRASNLLSEENVTILRNGTIIPKINMNKEIQRSTQVYCNTCVVGTPTCDKCVDRESEYAQKGYVSNPPSR